MRTECHPKNDHTILTHLDNSSTNSMKLSTSSQSPELFCCSLLCPTSCHKLLRPFIYLFHQINLKVLLLIVKTALSSHQLSYFTKALVYSSSIRKHNMAYEICFGVQEVLWELIFYAILFGFCSNRLWPERQ